MKQPTCILGLVGLCLAATWGVTVGAFQAGGGVAPEQLALGVGLRQERENGTRAELDQAITGAAGVMQQSGLAGVAGGTRLRITTGNATEVLLPIPQLVDHQTPLCYFIRCTPPEAAVEYRLRKRDDSNVVVSIRFAGGAREVKLDWSAIVLLAPRPVTPNKTVSDPYREATGCVQAKASEITKIAAELWSRGGKPAQFAASVQQHVRSMQRKEQPRSLDALGILKSGEGSICTANANLAAALFRARGIPCRSIAVVPPTSQRLEMHRIVEYFADNQWQPFDPSSLQPDVPSKPWHHVIVAKTTARDEEVAMKPRMGAMVGCPYGQEAEMLTAGIFPTGQDFFWTQAKPLAEFVPSDEVIRLATEQWNRYLETGALTAGQLKAAMARTDAALGEALRGR